MSWVSSSQKAKAAFTLALALLLLSGIASGFAITRLYVAETMVRHTYVVEVAIGDLESALTEVGRNRVAYLNSADPQILENFHAAIGKVDTVLSRIREMVKDNPPQMRLYERLKETTVRRVSSARNSVETQDAKLPDPQSQLKSTLEAARSAFETAVITNQMRQNEDSLLEHRSEVSANLFNWIMGVLAVSFLFSAYMFWLHYRLLNAELRERVGAENQMRQLSLQLMKVQDEEHRRFARELHDGLGQTLAAAKMMADGLESRGTGKLQPSELANLLGEALSQTRTISHLFHPPFLDEIGFASAARWLIDGYVRGMGVDVIAEIPKPDERLPRSLELTLYRVLQEALNNIHRHSRSTKAEVQFGTDGKYVTLRVKDYGCGIPKETLAAMSVNGQRSGVGLTGMKERVKEQGGMLDIRSEGNGTEITVKIPLHVHEEFANLAP